MTNPHFPHLFSEFTLRQTTLRNRVVMLPIAPRLTNNGRPGERDLRFYGARAEGGAGLIVTGGTLADPRMSSRSGGLWEAGKVDNIPAFRRLVDVVHAGGSRIIGQLLHPGREPLSEIVAPLWAPSAVASPTSVVVPHAMTTAEIDSVVHAFAASAANLFEAGYDGVELHGAHGFLIGEFFSPHANLRRDEFGLDVDHGLRLAFEIARRIRASSDDGAILGIRLSADEEIPGGLTPRDAGIVARAIGASGLFDYVSAAVGINGTYVKDMATAQGVAVPLAAGIRAEAGLPVIVSQRITQPAMAEEIVRSGAADLVGLARAHIADAAWAAHARDGAPERIVPCVGCLQECRTPLGGGVRCLHNPESGRETELGPVEPAAHRKRVVVVGGGVAGMEAARIATERGHSVVLFERGSALGGQVRLAAAAPHRSEMGRVVDFRVGELRRLGVDVRLGVTATAAGILAENPDAVVVATGAAVDTDGADPAPRVTSVTELLEAVAEDDLGTAFGMVDTAVVLDDGSGFWDSISAAEALSAAGVDVTVVTPARYLGAGIPGESLGPLQRRLGEGGVSVHVMSSARIVDGRVVVTGTGLPAGEPEVAVETDLVVRCGPRRVRDELLGELEGVVAELHGAGDCLTPRRVTEAVLEGNLVGRRL